MRAVDYIIIGQGICGTFLSYYLHQAGKKIIVIDEENASSATRVASGVINPVTGRSVVTTWLAEEILPFAEQAYTEIGKAISEKVLTDANIAAFSTTDQMQNAFEKRMQEANSYIQPLAHKESFDEYFHSRHEAYSIEPSYVIDLHLLVNGWRNFLQKEALLLNERFDELQLKIGTSVQYKNIQAASIIYCNGVESFESKYWKQLPYALNKGQALIIQTELPRTHVYKFGALSLVPWDDNTWWAGSSYENNFETTGPTEVFKAQAEFQIRSVLKKTFTVIDHIAGIRPAVIVERKPFVGYHPHHPRIGILNGMGTKGCSLAPFFAHQFTQHIVKGDGLEPTADVQRFKRILSETKNDI